MYETTRKWNLEPLDKSVGVCKNEHEKGEPCEYTEMEPTEVIEVIEALNYELYKCYAEIARLSS